MPKKICGQENRGVLMTRPCFGFMLLGVLGKIGIDQRGQGIDRFLLVGAVRHEGDRRALHDAKRQDAEKALGVNASLVFFDPDAALELICLLDEESRGPCMESHLVVDDCFFRDHLSPLLMHNYACFILSKTPCIVNRFSVFRCFAQRFFAVFFRFYFSSTTVTPLSPSP